MLTACRLRSWVLLVIGTICGAVFATVWERPSALAQQNAQPGQPPSLTSLVTDVAHLKDVRPPDSHPMVEAAMFAANLWYAGNAKNWPLANYYLGEARGRMSWETRLNPGPKGADGKPVDMASIFDGIDHGSLTKLKAAIAAKDSNEFAIQYKALIEDCYSCHKAANRPYLRPQVPVSNAAAQPIVNLDPNATWPE